MYETKSRSMETRPGSDHEAAMAAMREEQDRIAQAETQAAVLELGGSKDSQDTLIVGHGTPVYEVPDPDSKQRPKLRRSSVPDEKAGPPKGADEVKRGKPAAVKAKAKSSAKNQVKETGSKKLPEDGEDKADEVKDTKVVPKEAKGDGKGPKKSEAEAKKRTKKPEKPETTKESKVPDKSKAVDAQKVGNR